MKKRNVYLTYIYPFIMIGVLYVALLAFDRYDGIESAFNYGRSVDLFKTVAMIATGIAIALDHYYSPPTSSVAIILAVEHLIIAILLFLFCFSSNGWFTESSTWIWRMVAGYEAAKALICFLPSRRT